VSQPTPKAGATFQICRVKDFAEAMPLPALDGLNVTQPAWWAAATAQSAIAVAAATESLDCSYPAKTTDSTGVVSWTGLNLGLYLVRETVPGDNIEFIEPNPFLVTLPMVNAAGNAWNYDVYVYPKTDPLDVGLEKTGQLVQGRLEYNLKVDGPVLDTSGDPVSGSITNYAIWDRFVGGKAKADPASVQLSFNDEPGVACSTSAMDDPIDCDFWATLWTSISTPFQPDDLFILLSDTGMLKLEAAAATSDIGQPMHAHVNVTYNAYFTAAMAPGLIENKAAFEMTQGPIVSTADDTFALPVYAIDLTKVSTLVGNNGAGAEFILKKAVGSCSNPSYPTKEQCELPVNGSSWTWTPVDPAIVSGDNFFTGTWAGDWSSRINWGDGTVAGYVTNWVSKATTAFGSSSSHAMFTGLDAGFYWVIETKALEGHHLLPEPVLVEVGNPVSTYTTPITITNYPIGFQLPLTGGTGTAIFTIIAAAGAAASFVVVNKRARKQALLAASE
jgi:LPXTG-motif cell wall-anchored protein